MGQAVTIVIPFGTSQERPYIDERVKNKVYISEHSINIFYIRFVIICSNILFIL